MDAAFRSSWIVGKAWKSSSGCIKLRLSASTGVRSLLELIDAGLISRRGDAGHGAPSRETTMLAVSANPASGIRALLHMPVDLGGLAA
jgi:hypothetical protein